MESLLYSMPDGSVDLKATGYGANNHSQSWLSTEMGQCDGRAEPLVGCIRVLLLCLRFKVCEGAGGLELLPVLYSSPWKRVTVVVTAGLGPLGFTPSNWGVL